MCCEGWTRTTDLLVMSQASYHCYHIAMFFYCKGSKSVMLEMD